MNRLQEILLWIALFAIVGCGEETSSPAANGCYSGKVIKSVKNQKGRMVYDSTEKQYIVHVSIPGTYDSVDAGVLCDKLEDFEKEEGLTMITFDGQYFTYNGNRVPQIAGLKYYYLKITDFEVIK